MNGLYLDILSEACHVLLYMVKVMHMVKNGSTVATKASVQMLFSFSDTLRLTFSVRFN